jgi:hypothetical protein
MNKKIEVRCKQCGKVFKSYLSLKRKYCSRKCRGISERKAINKKYYCKNCNTELSRQQILSAKSYNKNPQYCSKKCMGNFMSKWDLVKGNKNPMYGKPSWNKNKKLGPSWNSGKVIVKNENLYCIYCGKMRPEKTRLFRRKGKYCSHECFAKNRIKSYPKKYCVICGKELTHDQIQTILAKKKNKYYCSKQCVGMDKRVIIIEKYFCQHCKEEITDRRHILWSLSQNTIPKYCSHECCSYAKIGKPHLWTEKARKKMSSIQIKKFANPKNHPNWKGGISKEPYSHNWNYRLKEMIRERDLHTYQLCNKKRNKEKLSVHHIDYNKKNTNLNNLISLCRNCHTRTINGIRNNWIILFKIIISHRLNYN